MCESGRPYIYGHSRLVPESSHTAPADRHRVVIIFWPCTEQRPLFIKLRKTSALNSVIYLLNRPIHICFFRDSAIIAVYLLNYKGAQGGSATMFSIFLLFLHEIQKGGQTPLVRLTYGICPLFILHTHVIMYLYIYVDRND